VQVVENIPPPVSLDVPMVLIKPPQACSTAEVYKVICLFGVVMKPYPISLNF